MDLGRLREATRGEHEATEAAMPAMGPGLTRAQYTAALAGMYRAVAGWDAWAGRHAPGDLAGFVEARRRGPALEQDLAYFGAVRPAPAGLGEQATEAPAALWAGLGSEAERRAAFLGMMYVVEGSTLGGQWIARQVEPLLGLEPGVGDAFFRGRGEETGARWKEFRAVLGAVPEEMAPVVIEAARRMFAFFRACLTAELHPTA